MLQKIVENSLSVRDSLLKSGIEADRVDQDKNLIQNSLSMVKKSEEYKLNRGFDLCIGILGLLIHAILFPFIAFAIKISSSGPVLYKQKRTGKMGVDFYCYKYRTMHLISLKSEEGKPIVTKKGEMSLVGPRPYPVEECKHWNNTFDDFYYRYLVKPGITGYAQVTGYRGGTLDEEHMRRRLDKDLIYVQKQNLTFDIKIIYLTIKQMVTFKTNAH